MTTNEPQEQRTPAEWMDLLMPERFIADHDGWRGQGSKSINEPISKSEFWRRAMISTLGIRPPSLVVTGGRASTEWERDVAHLMMLQGEARDAFAELQAGTATREEFVDAREVWRDRYRLYAERWSDNPEALQLIERRVAEAPDGWDD